MKQINETVAARTEPGVAAPIVQKATEAVNIDTGAELVKTHLLADSSVNASEIPQHLAEALANSMAQLLQSQKKQMLTQMKEASMGKSTVDDKDGEDAELLDVQATGTDEFTVMTRTGKPTGRATRRKADENSIVDDTEQRREAQKREAQEPSEEDAQAKNTQAIEEEDSQENDERL